MERAPSGTPPVVHHRPERISGPPQCCGGHLDNITHSLIGVLLGRVAAPWVRSARAAIGVGIVSSNLPDIDLVFTPFFEDPRLAYLVHHRGHTHTVVVGVAMALVLALGVSMRVRTVGRGPVAVLAVVAVLVHLCADAWNNYGVHPFWPFDSRWFYGDFIFIVEPWLWTALLPVSWNIAGRGARVGLSALVLVMTGVLTAVSGPALGVGWGMVSVVVLVGLVRVGTVGPSAVLAGVTLLVFGAASTMVRRGYEDRVPGKLLDVVLSPHPAAPWCWQALTVSVEGGRYHLRTAHTSLLPTWTSPRGCALRTPQRTAHLYAADLQDDALTAWGGRFEADADSLGSLAAEHCRVATILHFARAPYWQESLIGDLRYDNEPGLGFAEVELTGADGCMGAPWVAFDVGALGR